MSARSRGRSGIRTDAQAVPGVQPANLVGAGGSVSRSERWVAIGTVGVLSVVGSGVVVMATELGVVVPLERGGQFLEELDKAGGGLIGQIQRQTDDGQFVWLHLHGGVSGRSGSRGRVFGLLRCADPPSGRVVVGRSKGGAVDTDLDAVMLQTIQ